MNSNNETIKRQIKNVGLYQWQIADAIGISEPQFVRWLRHDLTIERKALIESAIEKLSVNKGR